MTLKPGSARLAQIAGRSNDKDHLPLEGEVRVEQLIRDAHRVLSDAGVTMSPSKVSRVAREYKELVDSGATKYGFVDFLSARAVADRGAVSRVALRPRLRYMTEFADPTGETVVRNANGPRGGRVA